MSNIYGQGIAFPPRLDGYGRLAWSAGEMNIRESIAVILKTNVRERLSLPTFGAGLGAFLFEPNNAGTHARIAHAIETALKQWEPRISLSEVSVATDPAKRRVRVQPGVVRNELNLALKPHNLFFTPETSTANRAMIGGMPERSRAGMVMRPPPPAMESTKPATNPAATSAMRMSRITGDMERVMSNE